MNRLFEINQTHSHRPEVLKYALHKLASIFLLKIKTRHKAENFKEVMIDLDLNVFDRI